MEWYHIYLFTRLDPLYNFCVVVAIFAGLISVGSLIGHIVCKNVLKRERTYDREEWTSWFQFWTPLMKNIYSYCFCMYFAVSLTTYSKRSSCDIPST